MGRTSNANERLMDAALSLMWEESYGAVTIDDICRRAEVKKGSFYYFFSSKSALAVEALERAWLAQKPAWDDLFSASVAPLERINRKCRATYERQKKTKEAAGKVLGCPLCCLGSEICTQDEGIRAKVREVMARQQRYWESAIRDAQALGQIPAGDPADKAACAIAFYEGMIAHARLHDDAEMLKDLPAQMAEHLRVRDPALASA